MTRRIAVGAATLTAALAAWGCEQALNPTSPSTASAVVLAGRNQVEAKGGNGGGRGGGGGDGSTPLYWVDVELRDYPCGAAVAWAEPFVQGDDTNGSGLGANLYNFDLQLTPEITLGGQNEINLVTAPQKATSPLDIATVAFWGRADEDGLQYTTDNVGVQSTALNVMGEFVVHVHKTVPVRRWRGNKPVVVEASCIGDVIYTPKS